MTFDKTDFQLSEIKFQPMSCDRCWFVIYTDTLYTTLYTTSGAFFMSWVIKWKEFTNILQAACLKIFLCKINLLSEIFTFFTENRLIILLHFLFPVHFFPQCRPGQPQVIIILPHLFLHSCPLFGIKLPVNVTNTSKITKLIKITHSPHPLIINWE